MKRTLRTKPPEWIPQASGDREKVQSLVGAARPALKRLEELLHTREPEDRRKRSPAFRKDARTIRRLTRTLAPFGRVG